MTRDGFLRRVYSVDTRAGDKLQYMLTKAEVCPDYAREISYAGINPYRKEASRALRGAFIWISTLEGPMYWNSIYEMLYEMEVRNG